MHWRYCRRGAARLRPNEAAGVEALSNDDFCRSSDDDYSLRVAINGSTAAARCAGHQLARSATPVSVSATLANVTTSTAETPNNMLLMNRVTANAAASPMPTPTSVSVNPLRSTSPTTRLRLAPSAMRIPSSRDRCATVYEITP